MRRFNAAQSAIVVELQQMLFDFGDEIDAHIGRGITEYYMEDGVFAIGETRYEGRAAIARFYAEHGERIRSQQKDGARQVLHAFVNVRVTIHDERHATLNFFNLNYAAPGAAPVFGPIAPNMIVECGMEVHRDPADDCWRIAEFNSVPQFMAEDRFAATVVPTGQ